jgi:hypothetical protein
MQNKRETSCRQGHPTTGGRRQGPAGGNLHILSLLFLSRPLRRLLIDRWSEAHCGVPIAAQGNRLLSPPDGYHAEKAAQLQMRRLGS